ncbi:hypothetical protein C8R43DRAFT_1132383 [Mycena crocata]|nr:hypothetical protein C8R43DRAFT_1132383 [Mycena crocata]
MSGLEGSSAGRPWELEENGELVLPRRPLSPLSAMASSLTNPNIIRGPPSILRDVDFRLPVPVARGRGADVRERVVQRAERAHARAVERAHRREQDPPTARGLERAARESHAAAPYTRRARSTETLVEALFATWGYDTPRQRRPPGGPRDRSYDHVGAVIRQREEAHAQAQAQAVAAIGPTVDTPVRKGPLTVDDLYLTDARPPIIEPAKPYHKCAICWGLKSHPVSHCYVCIRLWLEKKPTCPECTAVMQLHPIRQYPEEQGLLWDHGEWDASKVGYSWDGVDFPVAFPA